MKSVVITGADGFIGSHLVSYFSKQQCKVYAVIIPESPARNRIDGIDGVEILEGNLERYSQLVKEISSPVHAFIHLAWAGVSPEFRESTEVQVKNIELALNAVHFAAKVNAERFIFPGSTLEYSYCGKLINSDAVPSPQNAYGAAKISARYLCESMCRELGIPYIYAVITGIYGAGRTDNNVISYSIKELLSGNKPSLTRLEQLWDYIHIDDLVHALYLISFYGKSDSFYSIGHGDNWPLSKYIEIIRNCINPELPLGLGDVPYKDGRLPSSCVDLRAIQEDTGFIPQISFEDGIVDVIEEFKKTKES